MKPPRTAPQATPLKGAYVRVLHSSNRVARGSVGQLGTGSMISAAADVYFPQGIVTVQWNNLEIV